MEEQKEIVEKQLTPHQIASKKEMAKRREAGLKRYWKERHKEIEKRKAKEKREKEKAKEKARKEREKQKHKRPVGRPKKIGRKKKKKSYYVKKKKPVIRPKIDFKIVDCRNNKQIRYIGRYYTVEEAYKAMSLLMMENDKIIFPVKINHNETVTIPVYEYLILQKNRDGTKVAPMLRNEFGKLEEQKTNSKTWLILDKFRHDVEEEFWVWGFNNKTERKTFQWIYYNIVVSNIDTKYDIKRIILYKNKIIIKNDYEQMDMIICKTMGDAIRFYNLVEEWVTKSKNKQIIMLGSYNQRGERRKKLEEEIMTLTGWDKKKVQMKSTTKHTIK